MFYSSPAVSWRFGTQSLVDWNKSSEVTPCDVFGKEVVARVRTLTRANPVEALVSLE